MNKKALIYIEITNGKVEKVSKEIVSYVLENFENTEIDAVTLTDESSFETAVNELKKLGVNKLYALKDGMFDTFYPCTFASILSDFIINYNPDILLIGATDCGRELAPRIASKLNIGLTADCTDLRLDDNGKLLATRPTYGGKMMATIVSKTLPDFATVRPGAFKAKNIVMNKETEIICPEINFSGAERLIEILNTEPKPEFEDWTCSEIIVSGGVGLKSKENFDLIYKLADLLGGKPAASRAAVELGWAPQAIQVGQTGSSVSPKLYLAFGISGAMQHMVGIANSDRIIAVNTDKSAPIMQSADSAIVGDAVSVLNTIIDKLSN